MPFELETYHRNLSDSELIADLRHVASELRKNSVTRAEQDEMGSIHSCTIVRRFGSWSAALEKAELEDSRTPMNVPEEDLFRNLEEVWSRLGRQPRYEETCKPLSRYSSGTYEKRFGTWRKALEAFVAYINNEESPSSNGSEAKGTEPVLIQKGSRNINWRLRFIVMRRDNFKCRACGRSPATDPSVILHVDHVEAWSKTHRTVLENLQTLCSVCNIGKSDLDFQEAR
ncbi:MAG: HNH endonuclease [Terracidiphilus sp.]|jgi:hypothetical protein